jgi:predicted metal-binding protein
MKSKIESILKQNNISDYKWIQPSSVVFGEWVRMKCMYGCNNYGKRANCPPNVPPINKCKEFINEYSEIVIMHFENKFEKPEDRFDWTKKINADIINAEREVFLKGFYKAFALPVDSCRLCKECVDNKDKCNNNKYSRPAPDAFGIDVYKTARDNEYRINVLKSLNDKMDRFGFLLIE